MKLTLFYGLRQAVFSASLAILLVSIPFSWAQDAGAEIPALDQRFSDERFFNEELNLDFPGLEKVRLAVKLHNYEKAKAALAEYYRTRDIPVWTGAVEEVDARSEPDGKAIDYGRALLRHEVLEDYWSGPYTIDFWKSIDGRMDGKFPRMYWFGSIARAYAATQDPEVARTWVGIFRGFMTQVPPPADGKLDHYWEAMKAGIRLRSGWSTSFAALRKAPEFTDQDMINFVKSVIEQADFVQKKHWPTGNKIAYAMCGLFAAGSAFPELAKAPEWRDYAINQALGDLDKGYFPDDMGVEQSPGYHYAFTNYLNIVEIARSTGDNDPRLKQLIDDCERLYEVTANLAAPGGNLPDYQDGSSIKLKEAFREALDFYPENPIFRWFASEGKEGSPPAYRSVALPYAGYIAMRTGWKVDANYVGFDVGSIGLGHAHQDKLNLVMWAYGRMMLIDPGHGDYSSGKFSAWAMDTFAHNTALVDDRPQRRKWGKSGGFIPSDSPLEDFTFETTEKWDRASGVYADAYGLPGPSDSYPYGRKSNFGEGWGEPSVHYRRVFFLHPDIVVVSDTLVSKDGASHDYELRWTLDSMEVSGPGENNGVVRTMDAGQPNLMVAALDIAGLRSEAVSGQIEPIVGWNFQKKSSKPVPATTIRQFKSGNGSVSFLTLFVPIRANQDLNLVDTEWLNDSALRFRLSDGRIFDVSVPADPRQPLMVTSADAEATFAILQFNRHRPFSSPLPKSSLRTLTEMRSVLTSVF